MSCLETYATLRIFSAAMAPEGISSALGIAATEAMPADPESRYRNRREWNFWKWSTRGFVHSRDNLVHIQAITELLEGKSPQLASLRELGCQTDIFCYWVSSGQGGPYLDSATMRSLAVLGIDVSWDMYFGDESEYLADGAEENSGGA